jgi:3-methyladenine DNA glycosylase AlkD
MPVTGRTGAWARDVVARTATALPPLADAERACGAFAYMKGVAPFLGLTAPARRAALSTAWRELRAPTSDELGEAARALMALPEREYHYAAYDLLDRFPDVPDADFLARNGELLITTKPWWDTVDGIVNALVSPQMRRHHDDALMDAWSGSGDRWLVRAALGHQRGWKRDTDIPRMLALCEAHWQEREFFIAKAIGWALRDMARLDPLAVQRFLDEHDAGNRVAIREAERGLAG